jgi:hypothetical protein
MDHFFRWQAPIFDLAVPHYKAGAVDIVLLDDLVQMQLDNSACFCALDKALLQGGAVHDLDSFDQQRRACSELRTSVHT